MRSKLPQPHELDPTGSPTHRKLIRLRDKARHNSAVGLARRRQRDPTLQLVSPKNLAPRIDEVERSEAGPGSGMGENERVVIGKTTSSPLQPDRIDPGIGQAERQEAAGEHQEADPYQGEGQGRSVSPRGEEEDNSNVG